MRIIIELKLDENGYGGLGFPSGGVSLKCRTAAVPEPIEMCVAIEALIRAGLDLANKFNIEPTTEALDAYLDREGFPPRI
jgi:hypothetical protein